MLILIQSESSFPVFLQAKKNLLSFFNANKKQKHWKNKQFRNKKLTDSFRIILWTSSSTTGCIISRRVSAGYGKSTFCWAAASLALSARMLSAVNAVPRGNSGKGRRPSFDHSFTISRPDNLCNNQIGP